MYRCFTMSLRWGLFVLILVGMTFPPQQAAHAAATLSVTPITWNVVGLDSNNVNVGPNNFPVGVRVCNGGNLAATGITVNFVWESSDNYISLRSGSADPITFASLAASTCHDFYFEVSVSRDSAAYDHARRYHIQVTATNDGAGGTISVSSPTPREIYVEHLVSQKRNIVSDVKLDGVSIAAGGTMNLLVGSTYTIQLIGSTATNGYEQIESFINFPNTIFRVNSVTTTYTANGGADANVATKLYADGCGWVNDPGSGIYRSCLGTGKYGGDIVVTYDVTIIGGGGTNQTLNTLIYDFSGSSYHYNSDFSSSYRVAVIADPSTCTQQNITRWTFTGDVSTPSTGTGTLTTAGIGGGYINGAAGAGRAASYSNWTTDTSRDPAKYVDFLVPTSGFNAIHFNFADARSSQGPTRLGVYYSIDGITYNQFGSAQTVGTSWANVALDLSSLSGLSNNPTAHFRIYGYSAGGSTGALHLDTITVTGCALPASINLSKTGTVDQTIAAPTDLTNVGDRINYTLVITNNGGGNLTGITLTDTKLASLVCVPVLGGLALPPRQSSTCTGSYPLTQADFDTGSVTNTATARSVQAGPVTASTTQTLTQPAALTLTKSANPITYYAAGQAITYTYTLTNSGDVTLISPYTVADDKVAVVDCPSVGPLDPGASTTCTGTYTILPADISAGSVTNTASATASSGATTVTSNSASATITRVVPPSIEKSFSHDLINLGGVSTLTFTITNPNTTTALSGVAFSDTLPTGVQVAAVPNAGNTNCGTPAFTPVRGDTSLNFSAGIITAGGTCTVSVNVMALTPGSKINTTGNVTATNSGMGNTASATLNVNALVDLSLDKQVNNATPNVGSTVTFTLVVTNDGPSAATGIVVGDIVPGGYTYIGSSIAGGDTRNDTNPSTNGLLWTIDSLPSGTSVNLTYQAQVLGSGTYDNYAEIIDQDQNDSDSMPGNGSTDEDDDDTQIVTVNFVPALTMTKTVTSAGPYLLGSTITYNIVMTNTGDTTLTNVVVSDPKLTSDSNACASVAPNGTCALGGSYIVQQADVDAGSLSNTATVTDDDLCPAAGAGVCSDTVTVPISQNPSMTVAKSSATTSLSAPETVDYSYLVTNTGTVTLTGISLSDDNDNDDMSCPDGALAPGAVMTCTATHTFTQAELDKNGSPTAGSGHLTNNVTASSNEALDAIDSLSIPITQNPAHTTVKTQTSTGPYSVGNTITYNIAVRNTGNVTLTGVTVTDNSATVGVCVPSQPASLAPNGTLTCQASHLVTQADLDNGSYVNTATGDSDQTPAGTSAVTVNFTQNPVLTIVKSSDATGTNAVGDTITYTYDVQNTGNVILTNVTVTDVHSGLSAIICKPVQGSTLLPGATMSCTAIYTVTQADVDAGQIDNTGLVTGTPPTGSSVVDDDLLSEPISQNPALTVAKSQTSNGPYVAGDTITYSIVVRNTGNVTLTSVSVMDSNASLGACIPLQASSLQPNATMTCSASHMVTQVDLNNGSYTNTATGDSNETPPGNSIVTVNFTQNPAVNIAKTPATQTVVSGGTANFTLTVTNTGNVTLTDVTVTDVQCTSGPTLIGGDTNNDNQLQRTENWTYSCSINNVTGNFTNVANVSTMEGAADSDTAGVNVTLLQADLELDKSVNNATPSVAGNITFTLDVINKGPAPATGVRVTDVIPSGFTYVSDSSSGAYDSSTGVWNVGGLAINETKSLLITVTVNVSGSYENYAEITASSLTDPDSVPNNGSTDEDDDARVTVTPAQGDPSGLSKAVIDSNEGTTTSPEVAIGEIVTYQVSITVPPGVFANAQLVDTMERGLSYMDCVGIANNGLETSRPDGFSAICSEPVVDNASAGTPVDVGRRVTFDFGTLTNSTGSDKTLIVTYRTVVLDSAGNKSGVHLDNHAEWLSDSSGSLGPAHTTLIVAEPKLSISKTADTSVIAVGSEVTITLKIKHSAASETNAYDASLTDHLPAELQYVPGSLECASGAQAANVCSESGGTITAKWNAFELGNGNGQATFRVRVLSLPRGGITNTASVAWTSLPGDVSSLQNSNVFSTERSYDPGSQINIYSTSHSIVLGSSKPGGGSRNGGGDHRGSAPASALLPVTGFAPNRVTDLRTIPEEDYAGTGGVTVEIPSLGISIPIVGVPLKNGTWNVSWLGKQAGWLEGSAFPSWNGNSVLTGHVYLSDGLPGPFANLNKLKYGDKIIIHAYGQKYTFEVRGNTVVEPNDSSILKHEEKPWLTLLTCKEYDERTNTYRKRVAIRAVLVSVAWE